jgi:trk system potassium uptake protein
MSILIVGAGEIGYHVARRLSLEKKDVTIIDCDAEKVKKILDNLDVSALRAGGSSPLALRQAGIADAEMIIAVTNSDEVNLVSCLVAGIQARSITSVARIRNLEFFDNPDLLGSSNLKIDLAINPDYEAVVSMVERLQVPGATDVVNFSNGAVKLIGLHVENPAFQKGIMLQDLQQSSDVGGFVVTAIYRNGETIIPQGRDRLYRHDFIYAITSGANINPMMNFFGQPYQEIRKAMIVGGGPIGILLAHELEKIKIPCKLLEADETRCIAIAEQLDKTIVLHHSGELEDILSEEYIENTDIFFAVTDDEEDNVLLSLLAKQKGAKKAAALIQNMTYTQLVTGIGIDLVINPNLCAINRILQFIRRGKILSVASFYEKNAEAIEALALETSDIVGKPLAKLKFPRGAIIGAIIRNDTLIVPQGDSVIEPQDRVIIFAFSNVIHHVEKMLTVKLEYW